MKDYYTAMAESHRARADEYRKRARAARHGLLRAHDAHRAREHARAADMYLSMAVDADEVDADAPSGE